MEPFKVFTKRVFEAYQSMKGGSRLATELENPTGPKLRDQCLIILADKMRKDDHQVIKEFYDPKNGISELETYIKKKNPDIFKALINFMKDKVSSRDEKNVKLLATLIAFEPRPYSKWYKSYQEELEQSKEIIDTDTTRTSTLISDANFSGSENPPTNVPEPPADEETKSKKDLPTQPELRLSSKIKTALFALGIAVCFGIVFIIKTGKNNPSQVNGCMIWTIDRYEPIPCRPKTSNVLVIALDTIMVKDFRKIMRPDTIGYNAIGTLWYSKIDNEVEFFTKSGTHPVHYKKTLKPVTMHIIDTYVKNVNKQEEVVN